MICYTGDMQIMAKYLRKAQQKLQARIASFEAMSGPKGVRLNTSGYHRPGSMNRKKG